MDKLNMHTPNLADENFKKLAALFPNAVTETITGYDEDGKAIVERAIDKDVLMQEISTTVVEGREERYQFTWPDKKKAMLAANAPISATLRPVRADSAGRDGTLGGFDSENLYIEGDNLDVLKMLRETYLGKVKMIYIDPPYNTGNDFVYADDFSEDIEIYMARSGQYDEQGNKLVQNTNSNGRYHTDWLNMIYSRLKIAKDLLTEDGAIFISIDDNEAANLMKMCNEIFGEICFIADIAWQRTYSPRNDSQGVSDEKEHLLVYGRNINWNPYKLPRTEKMDAKYKNPDNDTSPWRTSDAFAPNAVTHQGMVYAIQHPFTGEMVYPYKGACWPLRQSDMLGIMQGWGRYILKDTDDAEQRAAVCGIQPSEVRPGVKGIVLATSLEDARRHAQEVYNAGSWPRFFFTKGGHGGIARKTYLNDTDGRVVTNLWPYSEVGHTDEAKKELKALFEGSAPFDTPKPTRLLERIITIAAGKGSLVLDFFSGSATTAHAVMSMNSKDDGARRFILVQLPEKSSSPLYSTLCDIGKERIRRAGRKIKEEAGLIAQDLDIGFRVLRLDSSNMQDVYYNPAQMAQSLLDFTADNIKPDRTPEDLLFQVMLELGVLPSSKIAETIIASKKVFDVADGFLLACFDAGVTTETVTDIAKKQPYYAVFRDSSMANDSVATNFDQIFETYSPSTVRKVL
jgi:adenine-specific DNA-methyltransferase